jgi:VWFA-related protein
MRVFALSALYLFLFVISVSAQDATPTAFGKSLEKYRQLSSESKKKPDSADSDVITVKTRLVVSDTLVVSPNGSPILGLKKDDFVVTENGVPQRIDVFAETQDDKIGRSIIVVMGYGWIIRPYIHDSVEAAKVLIDKLGPNDKVAIVSDRIQLLSGYTKNKAMLKDTLTSYDQEFWKQKKLSAQEVRQRKQETCGLHLDSQYSSLLAALNELIGESETRPIVIFQTDGDEYPYLKPWAKEWQDLSKKYAYQFKHCLDKRDWEERPFSFEDIKDAVAIKGATIYSVVPGLRALGVPEKQLSSRITQWNRDWQSVWTENLRDPSPYGVAKISRWSLEWQSALATLAGFSGGYTEFLENPKDAQRVYENILTIMNSRYVIGYYVDNENSDGKRRNLKVEVKGHPEYGIMSRKAYLQQ